MTPILIRDASRFGAISAILFLQFSALVFAAPAKVETYNELVNAIREVRAASQQRIEQAVSQEKVREAWETGKLIDEHILLHKERAEYGEQVLKRLSEDMGVSRTELSFMLQFARAYPIFSHAKKLSWSDYRDLLVINDSGQRESLADQAVKENWSRGKLRREIKKLKSGAATVFQDEKLLDAKPGTPGTYRVLKATVGEYKGELVLDLGFSNFFKPEKIPGVKEGSIVAVSHDSKGGYKLSAIGFGPEALFTYRADVVEVIDGDTIKVSIPLGFGFTTVQKLRLRGLDAPEIESAEGKEAKAFVEAMLSKTKEPLLIKTHKSDKYDRYLADVWIDNQYLNQALLDQGLAISFNE